MSVVPESAQQSSSLVMEVKTQASGEFNLEAAYEPMEDVTEVETDESSGAMRSWTNGGTDAARRAEALSLRRRIFSSFCIHLEEQEYTLNKIVVE